jgi:hypothetical protein
MRIKVDQEVPQQYSPSVFSRMLRSITQQLNLLSEGFVQAATNAATAAPTTGTYQKGDFVRSSSTTKLGTTGSRYIIVGWICTVAGTPGTWEEVHVLTEDITFTAAATQAEEEAASSTSVYTSPGRQKFHPGVAKAWVNFDGTGTIASRASHNVSSLTDNGVGDWTVNFTTAFSSANYCAVASANGRAAGGKFMLTPDTYTLATGSVRISWGGTANAGVVGYAPDDTAVVMIACFGDQ